MSVNLRVQSLMVELHRFGSESALIQKGQRYIRTAGGDAAAVEVVMDLDYYTFLASLGALRYQDISPAETDAALETLSGSANGILAELPGAAAGGLLQIDLVTSAAELWAFPFEACRTATVPRFASRDLPVVLTRRIRGKFAARRFDWPVRPRVLFAHAPVAPDLKQSLVDEHAAALRDALKPWLRGGPDDRDLLTIREAYGAVDLQPPKGKAPFTHVHLLAHGAPIPDRFVPQRVQWGLRLGTETSEPVPPEALATSLTPIDGLPVVVTIAACDSANQSDPALPTRSFAQELHAAGIPVVVASQLPLTMEGSVQLTQSFYDVLLKGEDVRLALFEARTSLFERPGAGHDWLSVVAYVRLPEGYADYLMDVGLRTELAMLDVAQKRADTLSAAGASDAQYDEVAALVRERISSLTNRLALVDRGKKGLLEECEGLLASAHKRLAELLFVSGRGLTAPSGSRWQASRVALEGALEHYRVAYQSNIHHHWSGVQQLALEAALLGTFKNAPDWWAVVRAAEIDRNRDPSNCWACGSLAEALLLAPLAHQPRNVDGAARMLEDLKTRAGAATDPVAVTRRQLTRYVTWWIAENGLFPGRSDLREDASRLLLSLD